MEYGVDMFTTDYAIHPAEVAREVEDRGFTAFLVPEHTHIPVASRNPAGEVPSRMYQHLYDPFVALSFVAAATTRLRVGTGVCLLVERDPITTAKEVATLDTLSGGRFDFGVGAGWNREEMSHHGTDPRTRMALLAERVHAMRAIWSEDEASFHGRFVDFGPVWSWPKPVQRPHPPVLVGGMGPTVLDRVLDFGDGWLAQNVTADNVDAFADRVADLQRRAADAGRGPVPVHLFSASTDPAVLAACERLGVVRCTFRLPSGPRDEVLPVLDELAGLLPG